MRHIHKVFYALLALCALALPCLAQRQRDTPIRPSPVLSQTSARIKRVPLDSPTTGAVILPKQSPLPRLRRLAPLSQFELSAVFTAPANGTGTQQVLSPSFTEHVMLSPRKPYVEGKGSLHFADVSAFSAASDWARL